MNKKSIAAFILVASIFLSACGVGRLFVPTLTPAPTNTLLPTRTSYPTYTLYPTYTPYPTFTPFPTFTRTPTFSPTSTGKFAALVLDLRARIDGISYLVVQGSMLRWYHEAAVAPGRALPAATYINGVQWEPIWPDVPDSQNVDCKCYSSSYQEIPFILNASPVNMEIVQARGQVTIAQQPDQSNDYALIVRFDDLLPPNTDGDEWYEIKLTTNPGSTVTPTLTSTSAVSTPDETPGLVLHFEDTFTGTGNEPGFPSDGLSFVPGHTGQGVWFNDENTLYYLTGNNINPQQGAIEFWLKPQWNGNDNQNYVFFEIGDSWFNRFLITKDGANNFRFIVWSSKNEFGVACGVSDWIANDWHQVKATWQNDRIALTLDGGLCGTQTFVTMPQSLSSRLYIGSSAQGSSQAQSVLDEFTISAQP